MKPSFDVVILGLSVTSSWGNGHATTYRSLIRGLAAQGHRVLFLERDMPWYAGNRDQPHPAGAVTELYTGFEDLAFRFERHVAHAELVIVGSFVPEGARVGRWVTSVATGTTAFYDIDTPITLAALQNGEHEHVTPDLIRKYNLYLSFTGGPTLRFIESRYGSPLARVLYCSVDPEQYRPCPSAVRWDLGYLGTYSDDRQPLIHNLLLTPAAAWRTGRFAVVGPMYPDTIHWPANVEREIHLSPGEHPAFYSGQRFTLNVTRSAMKQAGYSPSVRLFEAGACGTPIITDWWEGLDTVLAIGKEVLVAHTAEDVLRYLRDLPDDRRKALGEAARRRVLAEHTPEQRAIQLEGYWKEANDNVPARTPRRDGRRRKNHRGPDAWSTSQCDGPGPRATPGAEAEPAADSGDLQQPAGARP